jgi:PAS domain S-box-containing protein
MPKKAKNNKSHLDVLGSIVVSLNKEGILTSINNEGCKILGYQKKEIINKNWFDIFVPKNLTVQIKQVFNKITNGKMKGVIFYDNFILKKNGEKIMVAWHNFYEKDKKGNIIGLISSGRDITFLKESRERIKKIESQYGVLHQSSQDAVMTLSAPDWKFTSGNLAAIKLFGVKDEEELSSLSPDKLSPKYQPDGQLSSIKAKKMITIAMKKGSNSFEWTHNKIKGDNFFAKVFLTKIKIGKEVFLQGIVKDITEYKFFTNKIDQLNRFQIIIRRINQLLLKIKTKKEFFQQVCDILKTDKNIKFVWVGEALEETNKIIPITKIGLEDRYFCSNSRVNYDKLECDKEPIKTIIKNKLVFVVNDIVNNFKYKFWQKLALKRGYYSSMILPIIYEKKVFGVISIYSNEKNYFDFKKIKLFKEVANDIAVGIKSIKQERLLEESERKYRNILENADDLIQTVSEEGSFLYTNKEWRKVLGYNKKEALNLNFIDIVRKDYREHCTKIFKKLLKGESVDRFEVVFVSKRGKEVTLEGQINSLFENGKFISTQGIFRDITERKQSEERLKEKQDLIKKNEEKYRILFESSQEAIMIFSLNHNSNFISANNTAIKLFNLKDKKDLLSTPPGNLSPKYQPDGQLSVVKIIAEATKAFKTDGYLFEWAYKKKKKEEAFLASVSLSKIKIENEFFIQAVIKDITEKKKSEEKLKSLSEIKNKFIKIVSHQLRTPLTAIRWNLETILEGNFGKLKNELEQFIRTTYNIETEVIHRLNDLLVVMNIEENLIIFSKEKISFKGLLGSIMVGFNKKCQTKNIICNTSFEVSLPPINVDREKIRMAIENLLINAFNYTRNDGQINIKLTKKDNNIHFEVTDTGIGIPKIEQSRVFDKFFRASNAYTMVSDASGIGLAIAKYYINQHGGKIGFKSKEGKGTTFWFELPLSELEN